MKNFGCIFGTIYNFGNSPKLYILFVNPNINISLELGNHSGLLSRHRKQTFIISHAHHSCPHLGDALGDALLPSSTTRP